MNRCGCGVRIDDYDSQCWDCMMTEKVESERDYIRDQEVEHSRLLEAQYADYVAEQLSLYQQSICS